MEPVDPRMSELLSGAGAPGPDELRSIVSRAGRTRTRFAAIAAGLALAAGGGLGYGVSSAVSSGSGQQIVATAPQGGSAGSPAAPAGGTSSAIGGSSIASPNAPVVAPSHLQKLFTRQVGSIDIRGFLQSMPVASPLGVPAICVPGGWARFQAEVSTPAMVGIVSGFEYLESTSGPIQYTQPEIVGVAEGGPVAVVVAYTSASVAQVRMEFAGGGSDEMAPVQGWSALVEPYPTGASTTPTTFGTLAALDKSGHTLATQSVDAGPRPLLPGVGQPPTGSVHAANGGVVGNTSSGSASSGTGSSGSGSSGSGSSGSGSSGSGSSSGSSPPASTVPPGGTVYPCKVTPLPAQPQPATSGAKAGSGG